MKFFQYIFLAIVIIFAIPLGFLLARLTKEELKQGRKAFITIIAVSLIILIITIFLPLSLDNKLFIITSMFFLLLLAFISLRKSYKKVKLRKKKKR